MNPTRLTPMEKLKRRICIYCDHPLGDEPGHFVPPSMGEPGFPACESVCKECKRRKQGER